VSIQVKVGVCLLGALFLAFGMSVWFSSSQTVSLLTQTSHDYSLALREATYENARNVFSSLETGAAGSLERGEMKVFDELLSELGHVKGVTEIGLTDPEGKIVYSTLSSSLGDRFDSRIFGRAANENRMVDEQQGEAIVLARGHMMKADCLRCHIKARKGDLSGVLFVRYDISDLLRSEASMAVLMGNAERRSWITGAVSGGGGMLLALVVVALLLRLLVLSPIRSLQHMLSDLEAGNLEARLQVTSQDELGQMAGSMNRFADNLRDEVVQAFEKLSLGDLTFVASGVIREPLEKTNIALSEAIEQVSHTSDLVASSSSQVADASQHLSQMTTESAASLEEISSSISQMAAQTTHSAENAEQASRLAQQARKAAENGSGRMTELVTAMEDINKAGQNISQIIKVIDEIAFQTNLLALNAAVEAARAGQHGKGFAVVAEEVRNLASRSAKAAEQTAQLIEGSVEKTGNGSQLANVTAEALSEINQIIGKVDQLVGEIAQASKEQAEGIHEVNIGLGQIDQGVQQGTATAEQCAAAAEELAGHANVLKQMMGNFMLLEYDHDQTESEFYREQQAIGYM